jgi:hypothetical protein
MSAGRVTENSAEPGPASFTAFFTQEVKTINEGIINVMKNNLINVFIFLIF